MSLFHKKYTRTFVSRFLGIPEMLYFLDAFSVGKYNIAGIPSNLETNNLVYFPQRKEIYV